MGHSSVSVNQTTSQTCEDNQLDESEKSQEEKEPCYHGTKTERSIICNTESNESVQLEVQVDEIASCEDLTDRCCKDSYEPASSTEDVPENDNKIAEEVKIDRRDDSNVTVSGKVEVNDNEVFVSVSEQEILFNEPDLMIAKEKERESYDTEIDGQSEQSILPDEVPSEEVCNDHEDYRRCNGCDKDTTSNKICSSCKSVLYCSAKCQRKHWKTHKVLCGAIQQLAKEAENRIEEACVFQSHLSPQQVQKIANVIGKRCTIDCAINGKRVRALWDTGSQVALLSREWIVENFGLEVKIQPLHRLLGRDVEIEGVGGSTIPYEGYVELPVEINAMEVTVPFLVTKQSIQDPIIGYNVISLLSAQGEKDTKLKTIKSMLGPDVDDKTVVGLIEVLGAEDSDNISRVQIQKDGVRIKSGETHQVRCKIQPLNLDHKTPVLFEPEAEEMLPIGVVMETSIVQLKKGINTSVTITMSNMQAHDVWIQGKSPIGSLQLVKSVTPAEVQLADREALATMSDKSEVTKAQGKLMEHAREPPLTVGIGENSGSERMAEAAPPVEESSYGPKVMSMGASCADLLSPSSKQIHCECNTSHEKYLVESVAETPTNINLATERSSCEIEDEAKYSQMIREMDLSMLSKEEQKQAREVFWKERLVFSVNGEIGCAEELVMNLKTTDEVPVQRNYNSIPRPLIAEVKNHVEDLLNRKWIARSQSSWSSPVVIVRKKNGEIRLCCDFRQLNKKTVQDKHPLPRVQETLDSLGGSKWFTVLDQSRAYYQGFIAKEDRHKTAFVSPWGLYEWVRIPFGLSNAPAKFQRYMEETVADFRDKFALPYLDDVIVYSKTFTEHLHHISQVLRRMRERGLKLNLSKCNFFQPKVKFLGRIVTKDGYRMDEESVEAARSLKEFQPKTVTDVRHVMGLLGYHRRSVQDFSRRAKPITNLLLTKDRKSEVSEKKMKVNWTKECQDALNSLIDSVTEAPFMAYPDFNEEFILHTDASTLGLGCILYQKQQGKMRVIAYGSRTLDKAESNYHPSKLEFLALKWAVTERFRDYLGYADHFRVFTDNNPLVYCMETKKMTAYSSRWISELSEYNFTIKYRPGKENTDADCFSRLPLDVESLMDKCSEEVGQDAFRAIMAGVTLRDSHQEAWRFGVNAVTAKEHSQNEISLQMIADNVMKIKKEQAGDDDIAEMMKLIRAGGKIVPSNTDTRELKILKRGAKKLSISEEGVLVRRNKDKEQIVLPKNMRRMVYQNLHVDMGHLGKDKVTQMAKQRVYWPAMEDDIDKFINSSCICIMQRKPPTSKKAELQSIITSLPMELISVDFVKMEKGCGGYQYILVIVDHFSRFAQAYPTKNKSSKTAAQRIYQDFVPRYGIPDRLMSDQGGEFQNKTIEELNQLIGIQQSRTTPYHPQSNGACERMNETLLRMLRALPQNVKTRWPQYVNQLIHAYNCMPHCSTGYSPFFLMYGREPKLPIDLLLTIRDNKQDKGNYEKYVEEWKRGMEEAFEIAKSKSSKRKEADRSRWNAKPLLSTLREGDRVLVQNKERREGTNKLFCYWEPNVYTVAKVMDENSVVYRVKREDGKGRQRVLHRNMLLPVSEDFKPESTTVPKPMSIEKTTSKRKSVIPASYNDQVETSSESSSSDSDNEEGPTFFPASLRTLSRGTFRKPDRADLGHPVEEIMNEYMLRSHEESSNESQQGDVEQIDGSGEYMLNSENEDSADERNYEVEDTDHDTDIEEEINSVSDGRVSVQESPVNEPPDLEADSGESSYSSNDNVSEDSDGISESDTDLNDEIADLVKKGYPYRSIRARVRSKIIAEDPNITPLTKARCKRMDAQMDGWRQRRADALRQRRFNPDGRSERNTEASIDTLHNDRVSERERIEEQLPVDMASRCEDDQASETEQVSTEQAVTLTNNLPDENDDQFSTSLSADTEDFVPEQMPINNRDGFVPRALRDIADYNSKGLKEAPEPASAVTEAINDFDENIDQPQHESTAIDEEIDDDTWQISDAYFEVEPEEAPRRGARNRRAPPKFEYDDLGNPKISSVHVGSRQQAHNRRMDEIGKKLSEMLLFKGHGWCSNVSSRF